LICTLICLNYSVKTLFSFLSPYFNPNGAKVVGKIKTDPKGKWEDVSIEQAKSVACLVDYLLNYFDFTLANVTVHELQCSKTHDEGQNVYDAMLPYLNQHR
ncbi:MAG: hypothetical protein WB445_14975, partial [Acinetobacter sp.]